MCTSPTAVPAKPGCSSSCSRCETNKVTVEQAVAAAAVVKKLLAEAWDRNPDLRLLTTEPSLSKLLAFVDQQAPAAQPITLHR